MSLAGDGLSELHTHLGGSVASDILWSLAHEQGIALPVKDYCYLLSKGLKNTRLLNRLYSWNTKQLTPDAVRYGIGVTTPADMVSLMDQLYRGTLVDSASTALMLEILKQQFYNDMIPRFLPAEDCKRFEVAHKTGFINESKGDVALIHSDRLNMAIAVFVDKQPDHREDMDNTALLPAAYASRAIWNHYTGSSGYVTRRVIQNDVDWTWIPGGRWAIYRSPAAPFPHKDRAQGWKGSDMERHTLRSRTTLTGEISLGSLALMQHKLCG